MFFFPYRVNLPLGRIPVITILIALLCILVYIKQQSTYNKIETVVETFCSQEHDRDFKITLEKLKSPPINNCESLMYSIYSAENSDEIIQYLAKIARRVGGFSHQHSRDYIHDTLTKKYNKLSVELPRDPDRNLAYQPGSYNVLNMLSSQFAHADLGHLLGNLLFFFAFAASIEIVLGSIVFIFIGIGLSVITSLAYSLSTMGDAAALPTIGLSGMVMGMIGLFNYLMPSTHIRCLFIFIIYFRTFLIPAWLLASWYIGWDMYELFVSKPETNVNLVAHVSGAMAGYFSGVLFFQRSKLKIKQQIHTIKH